MVRCDACGAQESLPYNCRYCGGRYCSSHRLPENHDCPGLREFGGEKGVFDSGFDDSLAHEPGSSRRIGALSRSLRQYFRGNVTYLLLAIMWVTFVAQWIVLLVAGDSLHQRLFVLTPHHPEYVWTWITSIFAHDPLFILHIVFNSIVIFFFGPIVERYVGSRKLAGLFVASGAIAGLSQIGFQLLEAWPGSPPPGAGVLGASGAALAIMGVLTILNPQLRVYLYAVVPMPIWVLTVGVAAISLFFIGAGAAGAGGIAHAAHLVGLLVGLAYGWYVKQRMQERAPRQIHLGGGGRRRRF